MKSIQIRKVHIQSTKDMVTLTAADDEYVQKVEYEGNNWWVYLVREVA